MSFIEIENLSFEYSSYDENQQQKISYKAIDNLSLKIKEGSFVAILGHNGSGKSTLAKHLNGILKGSSGNVIIDGLNTNIDENIWEIRKRVGIIFQNPDNQLVSSIVEDDVAFGVENLGIEREEIKKRVKEALASVGMLEYSKSFVSNLSGGQKQRVAIAGILAMKPRCIVLDEPTAMLDPKGRKDIINTIKNLNKQYKITVVLITHYMEEVVDADRLIIMEKGKAILDSTPIEVFRNVEKIKELKLDVPESMEIAYNLKKNGFNIQLDYLKIEELTKKLFEIGFKKNIKKIEDKKLINDKEEILKLEDIMYIYAKDTVFEKKALNNINLSIKKSDFLGIIGHTGSGKSTLVQIFNALLIPEGKIYFNRKNILEDKKNIKNIRQKIGVVFQYPEYQLFEETVFKDVAFAPKNMGLNEEEIEIRTKEALNIVGLDETFYNKSPFELSGGEKRRVAIAGILAMKPDILVFDEFASGLDPFGREQILNNIKDLHKKLGITVVLISHSMEEVCKVCNRVIVLNEGNIVLNDSIEKVFENNKILEKIGLDIPKPNKIMLALNNEIADIQKDIFTVDKCLQFLYENLNKC